MTDEQGSNGRVRGIRAARLEAFSDGVFAIAITLLVLELAVPAGAEEDLLGAFVAGWPSYLAYVVSFATIGAIWIGHAAVTGYLERIDVVFVRLNLLLLLVVSFLPFPTRLVGEYVGQEQPERVATTMYGLTLFVASVLLYVLWRYAVRSGLLPRETPDEEVGLLTTRLRPGVAGYAAIVVLGLFLPIAAVLGYLAIALFYLIPFQPLRRRWRR